MSRSNWAAALALTALAGCAPMEHGFGTAEARSPRNVTVNVINGAISVTEDPVDLFARNGAIRWVFGSNPAGYVFPAGAIKFDANPPPPPAGMGCTSTPNPAQIFPNCQPLMGGEVFQCVKTRQPAIGACFKYDIRVELPGGGSPLKLDPWVKVK